MVRQKTISEKLEQQNDLLMQILQRDERLQGEKKIKFKKPTKGKLKKGYVIVQIIKNNNNIDFRVLPVVNSNIYLPNNETYHLADTEYIGMYKKWPIVLIPEWSNEPLTKEMLTRKIDENKSTIKPQKQIIHLMEDARLAEMLKPKKSMKGILMIGLALLGLYLIGSQLGWF